MKPTARRPRIAVEIHNRIVENLRHVRSSKVAVYFLLREFKRGKLYRWLDLPLAPGHAAKISAERRFATWEDYLNALGEKGISIGYFNELERLDVKYGPEVVRLCAAGLPVRARRILLRAAGRTIREVKEILASGRPDADRIEQVYRAAEAWQSADEMSHPVWHSPHARARKYFRQTRKLQQMLSDLVDETAQLPEPYRRGPAYASMAMAWKESFEQHLEIGERMARLALSPALNQRHAEQLRDIRQAWPKDTPPWFAHAGPAA